MAHVVDADVDSLSCFKSSSSTHEITDYPILSKRGWWMISIGDRFRLWILSGGDSATFCAENERLRSIRSPFLTESTLSGAHRWVTAAEILIWGFAALHFVEMILISKCSDTWKRCLEILLWATGRWSAHLNPSDPIFTILLKIILTRLLLYTAPIIFISIVMRLKRGEELKHCRKYRSEGDL